MPRCRLLHQRIDGVAGDIRQKNLHRVSSIWWENAARFISVEYTRPKKAGICLRRVLS